MKKTTLTQHLFGINLVFVLVAVPGVYADYSVVDTGQTTCFDLNQSITCPGENDSFYGQDSQYDGNTPSYEDIGNGTILDLNTGLEWQQTADSNNDDVIDYSDKMNQSEAVSYCQDLVLADKDDWRLPDVKTLYSLIDYSGEDVSNATSADISQSFLNTGYFEFGYGDTSQDERLIDAQWATTSIYVSKVMGNSQDAMFGVNFADGRIKGYGVNKMFYVQCVRGDESYGTNNFIDNGDGTVSDENTSLMWQQEDNGTGVDWDAALNSCEDATTGNYTDWRLPNGKELHSIVDYTRSPDTTSSAALDAIFSATSFINEAGVADFGFYWSSSTHKSSNGLGATAVYIAFGRALGYYNSQWLDVHGAGAQRSDYKKVYDINDLDGGYKTATTAQGGEAIIHGPQGDLVRSMNFVRCVRDTDTDTGTSDNKVTLVPIYLLLL